jgi:hypothetical protein
MEFGPAAGSDARAVVIVVKAPGVAPEQSTTAPSAKAKLERKSSEQTKSNFDPSGQSLMVSYPHGFNLVLKNREKTLPQQTTRLPVDSATYFKNASEKAADHKNCHFT